MSRTQKKDLVILDLFNIIYPLLLGIWSHLVVSSIINTDSSFKTIIFILLFFLVFIFSASIIYFIIPKLEEGMHDFPQSRISMIWILKFYVKKPLTVPLVSNCIYTIHYLSFLILKLLRCDIPASYQFAANVDLRDPELISIGENVTIGSDCIFAPHVMFKKKLCLKKIIIGSNTSIGAFSGIGLNTKVGKNCKIGSYVQLRPGVTIEDNVIIGDFCTIEEGATIKKGSIIKRDIRIKEKTVIQERTVVKE